MNKLTKFLGTGLAAIVFSSCIPNLSTPESALKFYFNALEEKNVKKLIKVLPNDCGTLRESHLNEIIADYKEFAKIRDEGRLKELSVTDSYDSWADATIEFYMKDKRYYFAFQLIKEADGKWKVVDHFRYRGDYLFICKNRR